MATRSQIASAEVISGLMLLIFVEGGLALDPKKAITQYHLDVWTEREGLPQGSVQAITQTRDGYLWIGTRDGLARFDGVSFTVFRGETTPGLPANDILRRSPRQAYGSIEFVSDGLDTIFHETGVLATSTGNQEVRAVL